MSIFGCRCKCNCLLAAVIASVIVGVVAAFLQITGMITVTPAFLWVVLGIAVVYLGILVLASARCCPEEASGCLCTALNALLVGILGAALFAVVLLGIGIVATSILSAVLVGLLLFFFSFTLSATACLVRSLFTCGCC